MVGGRLISVKSEERGVCVSSTFFGHKSIHRYTQVNVDRACTEVKCMNDFALVKNVENIRWMLNLGVGNRCLTAIANKEVKYQPEKNRTNQKTQMEEALV